MKKSNLRCFHSSRRNHFKHCRHHSLLFHDIKVWPRNKSYKIAKSGLVKGQINLDLWPSDYLSPVTGSWTRALDLYFLSVHKHMYTNVLSDQDHPSSFCQNHPTTNPHCFHRNQFPWNNNLCFFSAGLGDMLYFFAVALSSMETSLTRSRHYSFFTSHTKIYISDVRHRKMEFWSYTEIFS